VTVNQALHFVRTMCRLLDVSVSGYYASRSRSRSHRAEEDFSLLARIRAVYTRSRGIYGAPRIHAELVEEGTRVGCKRIARLMRAAGLRGVSRRRFVIIIVCSESARFVPDLVQRRFSADRPNQL
jgi:transposase InsO family protein